MSHYTQDYVEMMRSKGFRVTPQRLTILDAVCEIGRHATFGEIYQRVKAIDRTIDQSTIYRALEFLSEVGLVVSSHDRDHGKVYEIAQHPSHHHLVCKVCGAEEQISHDMVAGLFASIAQQYGFEVQTDHLILKGVCRACGRAVRSELDWTAT
jgi:Fur family ferric uptake transcriptional regulator